MRSLLCVKTFYEYNVKHYLDDLIKLRAEVLLDSYGLALENKAYKQDNSVLFPRKNSCFIILFNGVQIVGYASGSPLLKLKNKEIKQYFKEKRYNIKKIFLYEPCFLKKEYRGMGFENFFFKERERFLKSQKNHYHSAIFLTLEKQDYPKTVSYNDKNRETFFENQGFYKTELKLKVSAENLSQAKNDLETLVFWMKDID